MSDRKGKLMLGVVYVCFCPHVLILALYLESGEKTSCFLFPTMKKKKKLTRARALTRVQLHDLDGFVVLRTLQWANDTRRDSQGERRASHPYPSLEASLPESVDPINLRGPFFPLQFSPHALAKSQDVIMLLTIRPHLGSCWKLKGLKCSC